MANGHVKRRKIFNKKASTWKYYFQHFISVREGEKIKKILIGTYGLTALPKTLKEKAETKYIAPILAEINAKEQEYSVLEEKHVDLAQEWLHTHHASQLDFEDECVQQSIREDAMNLNHQIVVIMKKREEFYFEIEQLKAEIARYDYHTRKMRTALIQVKKQQGYSIKSIAAQMNLAERTVYYHLQKANKKIRVLD